MPMSLSPTAANTGAAVAIGTGVSESLAMDNSLLNSTLTQIASGDFTLYMSDIMSVAGLAVGVFGVFSTIYKIRKGNFKYG